MVYAERHNLAITVPGVGAYLSGNPTVAHTWCPSGTIGNYASMVFYPQGDSVHAQTDVLAATTDGKHILGAAAIGGEITLSDINFPAGISTGVCPEAAGGVLQALTLTHTLTQAPVTVNATAVNQVVTSPAASAKARSRRVRVLASSPTTGRRREPRCLITSRSQARAVTWERSATSR